MEYIDRETGQIPISIGTSLALEGFYGSHPNQPKRPSGSGRISQIWINLRTIIRNYYASMTSENARKATIEAGVSVILQELDTLFGLQHQPTQKPTKIVVYLNDLEDLEWHYPNALHKKPKTERQVYYHTVETMVLDQLLKHIDETKYPIVKIHYKPPSTTAVIGLLTHYPHELLWRYEFETIFLLESHTGKLKPFSQWYTKLKGVKPEDQIPFNKLTLQIFGDNDTFEAQPKKVRDEIKQIALTRKWNPITTMEKIKDDIRRFGGEEIKRLTGRLLQ